MFVSGPACAPHPSHARVITHTHKHHARSRLTFEKNPINGVEGENQITLQIHPVFSTRLSRSLGPSLPSFYPPVLPFFHALSLLSVSPSLQDLEPDQDPAAAAPTA